ncbi:DUF1902 domain-containing protein [Caulobacter segnis]|uniref:DUF1902 domain-containing protein n=1 Tax=Caulobacter segnis TaxID=88688 RepID=UPI00241091D6|nr:DUF1902 domain-containing protein [Caulobacter segnis]MDG2520043.1 DUF1902 domain-containing protein [Caulobacter segnis]
MSHWVQADWDADAGVWVSSSSIPGLVVEAATLREFVENADALATELLVENEGFRGEVQTELRVQGPLEHTII